MYILVPKKRKNIFQNQSQEILAIFEMAGSRSKVMCVPMDYAKKQRENMQAGTDRLDLMGICKMLKKPTQSDRGSIA